MTTKEFIEYYANYNGMKLNSSKAEIDRFVETYMNALKESGEVNIYDFGKIYIRKYPEKEIYNFQKKEVSICKPKYKIKFDTYKYLDDFVLTNYRGSVSKKKKHK